jgi:hypothetical protein
MHIIVILALGIVAWAAVEWMFFKEVARTWRDSKLERSAKICAVVMACIDIPLAWLSGLSSRCRVPDPEWLLPSFRKLSRRCIV